MIINAENWTLEAENRPGNIFTFSLGKKITLSCSGISVGVLNESQGINRYTRVHKKEKRPWYSVCTETSLPFGPEPVIWRKLEQAGNHIRVTSDISLPSSFSMDNLNIDSLAISGGDLESIKYLCEDEENPKILKTHTLFLPQLDSGFEFKKLPMLILFKFKTGEILEIGTGFDIWRWKISKRFSAGYSFALKKLDNNKISLNRVPIKFEKETDFNRFDFRFTWYFSWIMDGQHCKTSDLMTGKTLIVKHADLQQTGKEANHFIIDKATLPQNILADNEKNICFASRTVENMLKKLLRKASTSISGNHKSIGIGRFSPQICTNTQHLQRNTNETFEHWSLWNMMLFWEWGNIFSSPLDKNVYLEISLDDELGLIPSIYGMSRFQPSEVIK